MLLLSCLIYHKLDFCFFLYGLGSPYLTIFFLLTELKSDGLLIIYYFATTPYLNSKPHMETESIILFCPEPTQYSLFFFFFFLKQPNIQLIIHF